MTSGLSGTVSWLSEPVLATSALGLVVDSEESESESAALRGEVESGWDDILSVLLELPCAEVSP